ncbi:hypothetical protein JYK14_11490 [Siccirubricoccus sp. KC 17139]|uniref:Secreted protein n=1 Tax=Siccirubricoccus soli TaxID=2899147 RepID=A0ABT1D570_9PROT|nr:hypothetical protein [Siccirubricoccus soli]MCO6416777.1 hypothetical protein [Siccirubricoccus soli]MCP2682912.1 hypothetical protein [Siccirubricoccus soli]
MRSLLVAAALGLGLVAAAAPVSAAPPVGPGWHGPHRHYVPPPRPHWHRPLPPPRYHHHVLPGQSWQQPRYYRPGPGPGPG